MKKLMFIASAMLCVTALAALDPSATSLSSGVVGYQQVVIPAQQFTMIGVMYADMTNGAISVQDFIPDPLGQGLTGATGAGNADQLMYWDPNEAGNYVTLYLNSNTATSSAARALHNHWICKDSQTDTSWGQRNKASIKVIPAGRGIWYKRLTGAGSFPLTLDQPYSF